MPQNSAAAQTDKTLFILADDHRDSLERDLYGLTAAPTPSEAARITRDKQLVYEALLQAAADLPDGAQAGILVDEQYGASVAELAASSGGLVNLSMPLEASGHEWFEFAYPDAWQEHAEFFRTDHSKVLVRDNPGLDAHARAGQAATLASVSAWARSAGRPLILELLVPASDADKARVGGDTDRYDDELRPELTLAVMSYLQEHGVEPSLWKIEGLDRQSDAQAVAQQAQAGGRDARCIILGRHSPKEKLDHWLEVAAPLTDFVGFAIGRSIWWDALTGHLNGELSESAVLSSIAGNYRGFVDDYLRAQHGEPGSGGSTTQTSGASA